MSTQLRLSDHQYQNRFFESTSALHRLLAEAPFLPRCSSDKSASLVRPREYAIKFPYMQINRSGMVSWLIFDLDHSNPLIWEERGLPTPNIIVTNRKNGHAHVFYAIKPVCTTESARSAPINYMRSVYESMAEKMEADSAYSGPVAKTPGHQWWQTWELHCHEYELGELADSIELTKRTPWAKKADLDSVSHSRHCLLFEETRFYAYSIVNRERDRGSFQAFTDSVGRFAHSKNSFIKRGFSSDLSESQVKATVKSICRWTWDFYRGSRQVNRGVMGLSTKSELSVTEKQKLSAQRTHNMRRTSTENKIDRACKKARKNGQKLTQVLIAKISGLSRQTIAKYKHLLSGTHVKAAEKHTNSALSNTSENNVKHAVHQITALAMFKPLDISPSIFLCGVPPD